jgi:dienelactone hydrolase
MAEPHRREFDLSLELVTPSVPKEAYRVSGGTYRSPGGQECRYDAYLPEPMPDHPPPTVVLVHGDGPPEFLTEPRLWGQYRSWGALIAANGLAAIAFDHGSSEGRTRIKPVVAEILALLEAAERDGEQLGIDTTRMCVWSGSAGVPFGFVAALDHPSVRCQVAFYGPMDLRTDDTRTSAEASVADLAEYSPIIHLERRRGAIPPLFIAKAGLDRPGINDSIDAFVTRAAELGASVELEAHPDGRHAFDILDDDDRSREVVDASVEFMRSHLA